MPRPVKRMIAEVVHRYYLRGKKIDCPLRTLSEIIDEHHLERIDLLKIDTESAEFDIVAGLRMEHWPLVRQAVMEIHNGESQATKMRELLESVGFTVHLQHETAHSASNWSLYARRTELVSATAPGPNSSPEPVCRG